MLRGGGACAIISADVRVPDVIRKLTSGRAAAISRTSGRTERSSPMLAP